MDELRADGGKLAAELEGNDEDLYGADGSASKELHVEGNEIWLIEVGVVVFEVSGDGAGDY